MHSVALRLTPHLSLLSETAPLIRKSMLQIQGQSDKRGGDSSKILMEWIREAQKAAEAPAAPAEADSDDDAEEAPPATSELPAAATATATSAKPLTPKMRLLEVGCLSARNAISKSSIFKVTRIDLNAQEAAIESQDFMERPLPTSEDDKFDVISLSLVLNFVPEPAGRGEMLRRTTKFLRERTAVDPTNPLSKLLPSVFLVLPAPCLANSRHLNEKRLADIMRCIGYTLVKRKLSTKLIYGLWRLENTGIPYPSGILAKKAEVNPGVTRNNFAILLK